MTAQPRIGKVDFSIGTETYQTWYRVLGPIDALGRALLVLLHGGPGMTHHYMLPHKILFEKSNVPTVLYDQIGNGESSHIKNKPAEFWNPKLFMDELDNLLKHLGIYENFDLLGHFWGGMSTRYCTSRSITLISVQECLLRIMQPKDLIRA
ncbi:hypothetical protein D9619_010311 [Psilocybe cf. subviscida]|uniref:AB hydrolase-1 domain-containing protein n=1 Tax=Psilocybe cf. subviscida TaxID=2480587 RepID=A0A8H5ASH9_9AGAR|nr:hypothetical protein D9619_010311 [Psilocybe cf. subviscida]